MRGALKVGALSMTLHRVSLWAIPSFVCSNQSIISSSKQPSRIILADTHLFLAPMNILSVSTKGDTRNRVFVRSIIATKKSRHLLSSTCRWNARGAYDEGTCTKRRNRKPRQSTIGGYYCLYPFCCFWSRICWIHSSRISAKYYWLSREIVKQ